LGIYIKGLDGYTGAEIESSNLACTREELCPGHRNQTRLITVKISSLFLFDFPQIILISILYAAANSFRYATSFSTPDSGIAL
jgi:hypothetical protein